MGALLSQTIPFVHPGIAGIAVLCGLIPVVIHFINRRRHRRIRWAAMSFLLAANRRTARRLRFEHWLLMLARIGLVMLLGLAVARPFVPARYNRTGSLLGGSRVHRVLLLDNSLSMNTRGATGSRFDSAKACASRLIASFPPGDPISLVTLASPAEAVIEHPTFDRRSVRDRLTSVEQTQRSTDTLGALTIAQSILKESDAPPGNRVVYLISDFPRREWTSEDGTPAAGRGDATKQRDSLDGTAASNPSETVRAMRMVADMLGNPAVDLNLIRVYAPSNTVAGSIERGTGRLGVAGNVAISDLVTESALTGVDWPIRISARVSNFGQSTVRGLALQWRRDGRIVRDESLPPIAPGNSTVATASMAFARAGTHAIEARLIAHGIDAGSVGVVGSGSAARAVTLPDDDSRRLSIEVRESTRVLLIDGRPGARPLDGEAGFLATALAPSPQHKRRTRLGGRSRSSAAATASGASLEEKGSRSPPAVIETKIITREEIESEAVTDYDVIALCNVPSLSLQQWNVLERFTAGGRGLLVFSGNLVDAENYNRLGAAGGAGLLAVRIAGRPVGGGARLSGGAGGAFTADSLTHPIVAEFADHSASGLFSETTRVDRYLPVEPDPRRAEVALAYANGDPAWVASTYHKGRVLFCTTTANMTWNNLPAKGDYVSLMLKAVAFLTPRHGDHRNLLTGEVLREPLSAAEATMTLRVVPGGSQPTGGRRLPSTRMDAALVPYQDSLALEYGPIEQTGFVELLIGPRKRVVAVNVDPVESQIQGVTSEDELAAAVDRPLRWLTAGEVGADPATAARATELATIPLLLVLILLFVELWLGMWFRLPRGVSVGDRAAPRRRPA